MKPHKISLQINVSPTDWKICEQLLERQIRFWYNELDEIVLSVESQKSHGKFALDFDKNKEGLLGLIEKMIARYPKTRAHFIDYSPQRNALLSGLFFTAPPIPHKDYRGGPFYCYFDGLAECRNQYVMHLDADMILGGVPDSWLQDAVDLLNSRADYLFVNPLPGPPAAGFHLKAADFDLRQEYTRRLDNYTFLFPKMSTRVFLTDLHKLRDYKISLKKAPLSPGNVKWFFKNNWNWGYELPEVLISGMMERNNLFRVDTLGDTPGATKTAACFTLHPLLKPATFIDALPGLLEKIDKDEFPESQRGYYNINSDFFGPCVPSGAQNQPRQIRSKGLADRAHTGSSSRGSGFASPADRAHTVYVYPNISRELMGSNNPYIDHLKEALNANGLRVDLSAAPSAFPDFLKKAWHSDMVLLNWIEDLPLRRFGILQAAVVLAWLPLLKMRGVKIIWIRHNKISHAGKWSAVSTLIRKTVSRYADKIIVHSRDTGDIKDKDPQKLLFLPHPSHIAPDDVQLPDDKETPAIDLLIWGSLLPYKGILEFLQFVEKDPRLQRLQIHIVGKCKEDYWNELTKHAGDNIRLENTYVKDEELSQLFKKTRFILFTYNQRSVLSSGILMDSLVACKKIIAPDCGAFRDMAEQQQFVYAYDDFSGIFPLYREHRNNFRLNYEEVRNFVAQNSWNNMGGKVKGLISKNSI